MAFFQQFLSRGSADADAELRPAQLQEWLATLNYLPPHESAEAVATQITRVRRGEINVWNRLKLLEISRERSERLLPALEQSLAQVSLPLTGNGQRDFNAANRLLKHLAGGYADTAAEIASKWGGMGSSKPLRTPVAQALGLTARRIALAYRIHATGSESAWLDLHRLYAMAREAGFASGSEWGEDSPERAYVRALLLALAEPSQFALGQLQHVAYYVERHAGLVRLEPAPPASSLKAQPGLFLVSPRQRGPGKSLMKWIPDKVMPGDLLLDCSALVQKLDEHIDGLDKRIAPARLGLPKIASDSQFNRLLRALRARWSSPPARRHQRAQFHPRAEVVAGFADLWQALAKPGAAARESAAAARAGTPSEWAIVDESPEGFGLKYVSGNAHRVRVGEVLVMRQRNSREFHICIVRREVNRHVEGLELGIQSIAAHGIPASITVRRATEADDAGRKEQIIVLPSLPGRGNAPAILVPPDSVVSGTKFSALNRGERTVLRVGRRIERTLSCELFELEPVEA